MEDAQGHEPRRRWCWRVAVAVIGACLLASNLVRPEASPRGVEFLGYEPPGMTPERFAPGVLTTGYSPHGSLTFSLNQRKVFWSGFSDGGDETVLTSTFDGRSLSAPRVAPFVDGQEYGHGGPAFSHDGRRIFFNSTRPLPGQSVGPPQAIWYVDQTEAGWGDPSPIESTADPDWHRGGPSASRDGTLYFQGGPVAGGSYAAPPRLYRSALVDGEYGPPERLRGRLRTVEAVDPFVDPDRRFMLYSAPGTHGPFDLYMSFLEANGAWGRPINLANLTGTDPDFFDRFPSLSRDGKYLFFVRAVGDFFPGEDAAFYWVSSEVFKPTKRPKRLRVAAAAGSLSIRWRDRSKDESEFHLERQRGEAGWARIATLPRNRTRYTDTDTSVGTEYCYRVRAANFGGTSKPSNRRCRRA